MKKIVLFVAVLACLSAAAAPAGEKVIALRASCNAAANSTLGQFLTFFVNEVNGRAGGRVQATANYGAELGTQPEQVEMARGGSLEMVVAAPGTGPGTWVPQLMMFEFPYLFKDNAHYRRMLKAVEGEVSRLVQPYGFIAMGGVSQGSRHMLTVRPVGKLEDLAGLKMRGPNAVYISMFRALGAAGTTMDWNEIYTALQTKVIDGMEASPSMINSMRFQDNAKNLAITNHIIACAYMFFNQKWFDSLPADLQALIRASVEAAVEHQQRIDDADQDLSLEAMRKQGVVVREMPDIDKWVAACQPMLDEYRAKGAQWSGFIDLLLSVK
ncbi:MAG: TRAP transporter substrate-binding protein [Planctomycetota bacterium]|jgi:C4-dicarboxylate-binding protein DctP|nr:TRAP transporter substrate-binding protein [Planctomycetota bacterium]